MATHRMNNGDEKARRNGHGQPIHPVDEFVHVKGGPPKSTFSWSAVSCRAVRGPYISVLFQSMLGLNG